MNRIRQLKILFGKKDPLYQEIYSGNGIPFTAGDTTGLDVGHQGQKVPDSRDVSGHVLRSYTPRHCVPLLLIEEILKRPLHFKSILSQGTKGSYFPFVSLRVHSWLTSSKPSVQGFTLVELLAVLAIMIVLLGITVPAIAPLLRASNMNSASSMITDEFNFIRQLALTKNRDVEIRFYRLASKKNPTQFEYRAFRSFLINGSTAADIQPLTTLKYLPEAVIISSDVEFSTLFDHTNSARSGLTSSQETLPGISTPVAYVSFLFRATGGTGLSPVTGTDSNWFLTLYLESAAKNPSTKIPDNYINVQLDPVTGRARTYRP